MKPGHVPNAEEWDRLIADNYDDIYAFTWRLLGNAADAKDVTQKTFLKAYTSWPTKLAQKLSGEGAREGARRWLFTTARHSCIDLRRWWNRWRHLGAARADDLQPRSPSANADWGVEDLLSLLPVRQREVFILRHWHEFSTEETANILGISTGTVKSHLARAIERLRREFLERE